MKELFKVDSQGKVRVLQIYAVGGEVVQKSGVPGYAY